jgi:excisionase family DNA binding protein
MTASEKKYSETLPNIEPMTVSPDVAAARLGISLRSVYTHIATGEIRSFKDGKRRCIPVAELQRFIDRRMSEAGGGEA